MAFSDHLTPMGTASHLMDAANKLLEAGLLAVLETCGPVYYTGSYYLDLLAWPDLDIYLPLSQSESYLSRFLALGQQVGSVCDLVSLRFKNHIKYPEPPMPEGLYWGVIVQQTPILRWKVDIWALPEYQILSLRQELDRLKAKLTPENRALILGLKQALIMPHGRTPPLSGYHIYCAVLDHAIESLEDVKQYLIEKGVSF
jgi:hypothetical protein